MAAGVDDSEEEQYFSKNESLLGLFETDVASLLENYKSQEFVDQSLIEQSNAPVVEDVQVEITDQAVALRNNGEVIDDFLEWYDVLKAKEAFEKELVYSRRVKKDELLDLNLGSTSKPRNVWVSAKLDTDFKGQLHTLLLSFKDVFAWNYADMKGFDPRFYQHHITLKDDATPIWQQRHWMNPNYAAKVKEEIDKLLKVGFIYSCCRL